MRTKIKYQVGDYSLQRILTASLKAESSYEKLMSKTKNETIVDWINFKMECTTDFIMSVLTFLEDMNVDANFSPGLHSKINHLWMDVKTFVMPMHDENVVRTCLKIDDIYLKKLENEIKSVLITDEIYALYQEHKEKLRLHSEPIKSLELLVY